MFEYSSGKYHQDNKTKNKTKKEKKEKVSWKITKSFKRRKRKKQQYEHEWHKNFQEDEKCRIVEYKKLILRNNKKNCFTIISTVYNIK